MGYTSSSGYMKPFINNPHITYPHIYIKIWYVRYMHVWISWISITKSSYLCLGIWFEGHMSLISSRPWSWKRSGSGHRGKWNSTCSGQWPFPKAWGAVWSQMWVTRKNRWAKIEPMACPTTGIYLYISMRTAAPPVEAPESEASQLQLMTPPPLTPWSILGFTMDFPPVNGCKVIFRELPKTGWIWTPEIRW